MTTDELRKVAEWMGCDVQKNDLDQWMYDTGGEWLPLQSLLSNEGRRDMEFALEAKGITYEECWDAQEGYRRVRTWKLGERRDAFGATFAEALARCILQLRGER
jgi:hypothetical protein